MTVNYLVCRILLLKIDFWGLHSSLLVICQRTSVYENNVERY